MSAQCVRALAVCASLLALSSCDRAPEPSDRRPARSGAASAAEEGAEAEGEGEPGAEGDEAEAELPELTGHGGPVRIELDRAGQLVLRIAEHDAHADVERIDARTVRVGERTADVAALDALCVREPSACDAAIDAWALRLVRPVDTVTEDTLGAILVPAAEVALARAGAREAGLPEPVVGRPWTEPFFLALVAVEPDVIRQLEASDVAALGGRDVEALEALALTNLERTLGPIRHESASPTEAPNVRVVAANDGLSTSRLLLVDRWRELARGVHGDLVVSAPTAQTLVFCGADEPLDVAMLAYLARRMFVGETSPVSPAILRLGADGWRLESLNDRPDPERDAPLDAVYGAGSAGAGGE